MKSYVALFFCFLLPIDICYSQSSSGQAWLAFGDLRGHIEPCGCDPATDLGGVRRIDMLIQQERAQRSDLKVLSLGNLLSLEKKDSDLKNEYILRALSRSAVTATLVGPSELHNLSLLIRLAKEDFQVIAKNRFLLSNAKKSSPKIFAPELEDGHYQIFGYFFDPRWPDVVENWNAEKIADLARPKATPPSARKGYRVLLFRGPVELLKEVAKKNTFDAIISGNVAAEDTVPGQDEKLDEQKLILNAVPLLMQVPLGGQGILRGGILQNRRTESIQDILKGKSDKSPLSQANVFTSERHLVTWLDPPVGHSPNLDSIFEEYENKVKVAFQTSGGKRIKDLKQTPYGGVKSCETCHRQAVDVYDRTKHAKAMDTLIKKGKEQDPYCVSCHSVGSKEKGGFVSVKDSPFLSHVQCENCHGPRKNHAQNPVVEDPHRKQILRTEAQKICVDCHNQQHSPNFDQNAYWEKIKHSH